MTSASGPNTRQVRQTERSETTAVFAERPASWTRPFVHPHLAMVVLIRDLVSDSTAAFDDSAAFCVNVSRSVHA